MKIISMGTKTLKTFPHISVSIVSHNQGKLIRHLLADLQRCRPEDIEVLLTLNTHEVLPFFPEEFSFPLRLIQNNERKGFGKNHNQAFKMARGEFFCVLNPDVRIGEDPFLGLLNCLKDKRIGVIAPLVKDEEGRVSENARKYPTPLILLRKLLKLKNKHYYLLGKKLFSPDWIGGMFMLFPSEVFRQMKGFDEKYFLYYEDVDLCARIKLNGYKVIHYPFVSISHKAQYDSHRKIRYLVWHIFSIMRFFFSNSYLNAVIRKTPERRIGLKKAFELQKDLEAIGKPGRTQKILIVTQYFWPENFRINDLAIGMLEHGYEVKILTGMPNYPTGNFFDGYGTLGPFEDRYHGMQIFRIPLIKRGKGGRIRLTLNYLSFVFFASIIVPFRNIGEVDLIFIYEPSPITVCLPALLLKAMKSAPVMLWMQDLWPESLSATGAVRSNAILKMVDFIVRIIYRECDRILLQSRAFIPSVLEKGANARNLLYFPNSAEDIYKPIQVPHDAPERVLMPDGFCITFAGNIGASQDFSTILSAAELLHEQNDIQWVIIGEGRMYGWVREQITKRQLNNTVHLLGRHSINAMPRFFALSDALMVSLKKEPIFSLTIPSKVQSYLACARPVIAALEGEGRRVIEEAAAGLVCKPEDPEALANIVLELYRLSQKERKEMGIRGRRYFEEHFEREKLLESLKDWIQMLICSRAANMK